VRIIGGAPHVSVPNAARILSYSSTTVRRLADSGRLRSIRLGSRGWRFVPLEDVERLLRDLNDDPARTAPIVTTAVEGGRHDQATGRSD
jgi:excisionase family DNA binding protein